MNNVLKNTFGIILAIVISAIAVKFYWKAPVVTSAISLSDIYRKFVLDYPTDHSGDLPAIEDFLTSKLPYTQRDCRDFILNLPAQRTKMINQTGIFAIEKRWRRYRHLGPGKIHVCLYDGSMVDLTINEIRLKGSLSTSFLKSLEEFVKDNPDPNLTESSCPARGKVARLIEVVSSSLFLQGG